MFLNLVLLTASVAILWKCADRFVEGAVGIAERLRVPHMLVGLVLVSICTTSPELMASLMAALQGKPAMAEFYDKNIRDAQIVIETHESYFAGRESAHKMTLTTTLSNGIISKVTSIFTYRLNEEGLISNLRGYWKLSDMSFTHPD